MHPRVMPTDIRVQGTLMHDRAASSVWVLAPAEWRRYESALVSVLVLPR